MSHAIAACFDATLRDLQAAHGGDLTHDDLLRQYPPAKPTSDTCAAVPSLAQVKFYADFASDPAAVNAQYQRERDEAQRVHGREHVWAILRQNKHHKWRKHRQFDARLTHAEEEKLAQHGIAVSARHGEQSFADVYYKLYTDDLPVFVTSDSVLHAWHWSFDMFLTDLEMEELMPLLGATLAKTLAACATEYDAAVASGNTAAQAALGEVELHLATAHRLLIQDPENKPQAPEPPADEHEYYRRERLRKQERELAYEASLGLATPLRVASNANRLAALLAAVKQQKTAEVTVLGAPRDVDFSLFTPRGHYVKTEKLQRYFRAMSWLGTVDFRIDGASPHDEVASAIDRFQLQCACMAVHVLRQADALNAFATIHETIAALAGDGVGADSMTPHQLHELLGHDKRDVLAECCGADADAFLTSLQNEIAARGLGAQAIAAHPMVANASPTQPSRPPTAFALLGQQFVWSAFVFSKLVFDQVVVDGAKVPRRMVSGVDAAFALFGNDGAAGELAARMTASPGDPDFVKFRDGLPYASSLIAARQVVDDALKDVDPTTSSMALLWQLALRELSKKSENNATVFQSDAWQKRQMNTQLASFAQLRHDTILYAKQGSTCSTCCEYPAGYVDPYPSFWRAMNALATRTLAIIERLQFANGTAASERRTAVKYKGQPCFANFVSVTQQLEEIATAQAAKQELSDAQVEFLKTVMEESHGSGASRYLGWYPGLFYGKREDSSKPDRLVADVHTDQPSQEHGDAGGVLHVGVGDVNLALVVVDDALYAGPVFSYYELVTPIDERLTDDAFSARLPSLEAPKWARDAFLV